MDERAVEVDGDEARLECRFHVLCGDLLSPVKIAQSLDDKAFRSGLYTQSLVSK
jgi:hypothetical protein